MRAACRIALPAREHTLQGPWQSNRPSPALTWRGGRPLLPEALRLLAVEVALEVLPHKTLNNVHPERVVQSVTDWDSQTTPEQTTRLSSKSAWQGTMEEAVREVLPAADAPDLAGFTADELEQSARTKSWLARAAKRILEQLPHTRGDQDARVGRTTSYTWFCGYLMGFVVDGLHHIITAVAWGVGNVKQALLFCPAMEQHQERVPGKPKGVAIDSAFDEAGSLLSQWNSVAAQRRWPCGTPALRGYRMRAVCPVRPVPPQR
jgi:hypothetical protein